MSNQPATTPTPAQPAGKPAFSEERILKVGGGSACKSVAVAILGVINNEKRRPVLEFVGAGACNQAVKAVAIASSMLLEQDGRFLSCTPGFIRRGFKDNDDVTAMQLVLMSHRPDAQKA